jgi:hypothetical protein
VHRYVRSLISLGFKLRCTLAFTFKLSLKLICISTRLVTLMGQRCITLRATALEGFLSLFGFFGSFSGFSFSAFFRKLNLFIVKLLFARQVLRSLRLGGVV